MLLRASRTVPPRRDSDPVLRATRYLPPIKTRSSHIVKHAFIAKLMRSGYGVLQHATTEDMFELPDTVPKPLQSLHRLHEKLMQPTLDEGAQNFGSIVVDLLLEDMEGGHAFPWGLDVDDQVDRLALLIIAPKNGDLWMPREFVALGTSERAFDVLAVMLALAA